MVPLMMGEGLSLWFYHLNRGKEPKLTSSAPSSPPIYQTSVTKLLDLEASTPYLKKNSKRGSTQLRKGSFAPYDARLGFEIYKLVRGRNESLEPVL